MESSPPRHSSGTSQAYELEVISDPGEQLIHRRMEAIYHPPIHGPVNVSLVQTQPVQGPAHLEIAERLIGAFTAASRDEAELPAVKADDMWTHIQRGPLGSLKPILERRDPKELSEYLLRFGEKPGELFGGFTFRYDGYTGLESSQHLALAYFDKVVCLAEAMGCIRCENPEQGEWGVNLYLKAEDLLAAIEREFGGPITPPQNTLAVLGIQTSHGVLNYRHLNALYVAWRIRQMLSAPTDAVCEYGGGLGTIPYYLRSIGVLNYTIYDLPIANVFAAHFLLNSLSPEDVVLYGERSRPDATHVLPYWESKRVADKQFGLTVNQDSFPEIDEATVRGYLSDIQRTTRDFFVSINHEAETPVPRGLANQLNVSRLLRSFPSFHRLHRSRYWMREGYVEEIYRIA